jgi:ubiquinone/menaquinone biosynthesis C-methylase UbiE
MNRNRHEPYDALASIYDHWQRSFDKPYHQIVFNLLKKDIRRYRIKPYKFLDLACGTGDVALFMAARGWQVTGVDSSENMLKQAEQKAGEISMNISFYRQRLEELVLEKTFQLAGSFYDSLNHITSKRTLLLSLKRIRKHLDRSGLFIFDSNTLSCYRNLWNTTSVGHEDYYTLIIESKFDELVGKAVSDIEVFERGHDGLYQKRNATVQERWYSNEEFETLLFRAGFEVIRCEPLYLLTYNEPEPYKQWWVCKAV